MNGTVTATMTRDWLTPFEVTVAIAGREPSVSRHVSAAQAQRYMVDTAAEHDLELVYALDVSRVPLNSGNSETQRGGEPRRITVEEFQQRVTKICGKCRQAKPLATYEPVYHRNRGNGRTVHHGWADRCGDCEASRG